MARRRKSKSDRRFTHGDQASAGKVGGEEDLFSVVEASECPVLLVLDGVQDPHNLGACLRSAAAAGVVAVVAPRDRAAPMTDTVRRISCGGADHVLFVRVTNIARTLQQLGDRGLRLVGTSDDAKLTLYESDLTGPLAVVLGAEGQGLRRLTRQHCDVLVRIPMTDAVECLNVSVAAGVCLFEALRQRRGRR